MAVKQNVFPFKALHNKIIVGIQILLSSHCLYELFQWQEVPRAVACHITCGKMEHLPVANILRLWFTQCLVSDSSLYSFEKQGIFRILKKILKGQYFNCHIN